MWSAAASASVGPSEPTIRIQTRFQRRVARRGAFVWRKITMCPALTQGTPHAAPQQ
jgi:hypothetical protein